MAMSKQNSVGGAHSRCKFRSNGFRKDSSWDGMCRGGSLQILGRAHAEPVAPPNLVQATLDLAPDA
eukprot:4524558-Amphidinium_carterae.1